MKTLSRANIIRLNQITIEENGGHFVPPENLLHGAQIDYLVDTIDAELFGEPMYPTAADKAAVYMFSIISNHVFQDGNKRTGLTAALTFLFVNGFEFKFPFDNVEFEHSFVADGVDYDDDLEAFTLAVASAKITQDECRR